MTFVWWQAKFRRNFFRSLYLGDFLFLQNEGSHKMPACYVEFCGKGAGLLFGAPTRKTLHQHALSDAREGSAPAWRRCGYTRDLIYPSSEGESLPRWYDELDEESGTERRNDGQRSG
jgi:hypothetical protein